MSLFVLLCAFFFLSFFLGCLIHCHVQFVACTFVTCSNKDQSINQSINQVDTRQLACHVVHIYAVVTGVDRCQHACSKPLACSLAQGHYNRIIKPSKWNVFGCKWLSNSCAGAMRPLLVKLLWPLVCNVSTQYPVAQFVCVFVYIVPDLVHICMRVCWFWAVSLINVDFCQWAWEMQ